MLNNFIYAKLKSLFEEALNNGEVLDEAIVFIEDTKEIWNHGTYFDGNKVDLSNIETSILNILNTKLDNISDLETIRSGAALGATALQEEQYKGTVTSVKINGTTKTPDTNGMVDLGTIGGGGSSSGDSGAYAEVNHGTGDTTFTLTPNTFHVWDEVTSLDLSFADETAGVANEYLFQFTSGATATTLTLPDGLKWTNELIISPNMIFQVSVLKGLASVLSWDNSKSVFPASLVEGDNGEIGVNVYQELKKHIQLKEGDLTLTINGTSYSIISYEKDYDYTNDGFILLTINDGPSVIYYILEGSGDVIDFTS